MTKVLSRSCPSKLYGNRIIDLLRGMYCRYPYGDWVDVSLQKILFSHLRNGVLIKPEPIAI